ncbi:ATP-dependent DNA helicase [Trichonephila clavipes]|nr:ATP-dependent DNA helicase [Trichonephila clavipes]
MKVARLNEMFPQAELRKLEQAEREAAYRAAETPEQSQDRRQQNAQYLASQRADKTLEQSQDRRRQHVEYLTSQRAAETPEQSQTRRLQQTNYIASQRDAETVEVAESRRRAVAERAQQLMSNIKRNTWGLFDKAAFEYDETYDFESHKLIKIEAMNKECRFCSALKWKEEAAGMCCSGGKVVFPSIDEPVEPLKEFISYQTVHEFKMAKDRVTSYNYNVVIHPDRVPRGEHEKRFNTPNTNEIAA